ncbi:hypothetical protein FD754_021989, partial [Muntiacus muntjak]
PSLSHENLPINVLIREYLKFNMSIQFLICELSDFEESKDNT